MKLLPAGRRSGFRARPGGASRGLGAGAAAVAVSTRTRWPALVALGMLSWVVLAVAQISIPLTERRAGPTVVVVVAATVAAWAWAATAWGVPRATQVLVWIAGSTLLIEWVGTNTGFPFGSYRYTGALQPQVAGVPLVVPLAWFAVGVPALEVAGRLTTQGFRARRAQPGGLGRPGPSAVADRLPRVVVAALALTAWDLFLDPQMVREGYWQWDGGGAYRGIPLSNYLGWFASALVVLALADRIAGGSNVRRSLPLLGLYTWWAVMETVGFLFFFDDAVVALVGGLAMGLPTVLAWRRTPVGRGLALLHG